MAIFGTFDEIPPQEALTAVAARTGIFAVRLGAGPEFALHLHGHHLTSFRENSRELDDVLVIRDRFAALMTTRQGAFHFQRTGPAGIRQQVNLPLTQLVASAMNAAHERRAAEEELPSEHTRFVLVEEKAAPSLWLGEELELFWERARDHLAAGTCAAHLANSTGLTVLQTRWLLYRLRLAGLIRSRRLNDQRPPSEFGLAGPRATSLAPAAPATPLPGDLSSVRLAPPNRPFLQRLLSGITRFFN